MFCIRRLADGEQLRDRAEVLLGYVDRDALDRLVELAVDLLGEHDRLADVELETLAAHLLDEDRQLQLATSLDLPGIGSIGRVDADADVADELLVEPVLHEAGGELRTLAAGERRRVDADRHRQRRLVDGDDGQRTGIVGIGQRLADVDVLDAGDGDEITLAGLVDRDPGEVLGEEQLGDLRPR